MLWAYILFPLLWLYPDTFKKFPVLLPEPVDNVDSVDQQIEHSGAFGVPFQLGFGVGGFKLL